MIGSLAARSSKLTRPVGALALLAIACADRSLDAESSAARGTDGGADGGAVVDPSDALDSVGDEADECVHAFLDSAGSCDIALQDEPWIDRLDCRALIRLGATELPCGPGGWIVVGGERLQLRGVACDLVQAEPDTKLEVLIPCTLVPEP